MSHLTQIGVLLLLVAHSGAGEVDPRYLPRKNKPLGLDLKLMDGGFLGSYRLKQVKAVEGAPLPFPHFYFVRFFWDGGHLQIRPGEDDEKMWSKEAIAKSGWYLTADYSTDPPRIIVTETPTAASRWKFVSSSPERALYSPWYLKNENSPGGKDAWVAMPDRGKRYLTVQKVPIAPGPGHESGGEGDRYWEGTVSDAILTFDKDKAQAFDVADIEHEDGK
jgi:hypothetical protein